MSNSLLNFNSSPGCPRWFDAGRATRIQGRILSVNVLDQASLLSVLALAVAYQPRRRWVVPLVAGGVVVALTNLPALSLVIPGIAGSALARGVVRLQPGLAIVGNAVAFVLFVWAAVRLFRERDPALRMAARLRRRGDLRGAAELYFRAGQKKRALAAFKGARAWTDAARVSLELGRDRQAAEFLKLSGGLHLQEAARLFGRCGEHDEARSCYQTLAQWLMSSGKVAEAIAAWMRAGEPVRAAAAAGLALDQGRLQPAGPEFEAARRAAETTRQHKLTARLAEAEGDWRTAARSWGLSGDHRRAAECLARGGDLSGAAGALESAGEGERAARLRLQEIETLMSRLRMTGGQQSPGTEALKRAVASMADQLLPRLERLSLDEEYLDLLARLDRIDEGVDWLVRRDRRGEAADLATGAQRWELAGPILERLGRWGEASDVWELAGKMADAARCAEHAGEDERALNLYRGIGDQVAEARCLARVGRLQEALANLHRAGRLAEATELLQEHPGPVPDIPDVILDLAAALREAGRLSEAIACMQRAVIGVALQPSRLQAATALARLLLEAGDVVAAQGQVRRVIDFDYGFEPAHDLQREIKELVSTKGPAATRAPAAAVDSGRGIPDEQGERYEILTEVGRGGMGVVYQARDKRLERVVAVKVLRATADPEVEQLRREAKAAATLNHPAIVTVYDFEKGLGGYLIAMELVRGESLDLLLRTSPERIRANLLAVLIRLADAVAYAHENHVIHRDLKPGNILLTADNQVKIFDFGIAARLDSEGEDSGGICGTPFYMSPEQIRGEPPTPASDIYSLGATFFHLATGRPPFTRGNVIEAHLSAPAPNPLDLVPGLPPGLDEIIGRCLAKDSGDRYHSARDLHGALLRLAG